MLRRHEAAKHRQQKKDELEAAESLLVLAESSNPGGLAEEINQNEPISQISNIYNTEEYSSPS